MGIRCTVVDAGARYGLHPTWSPLQGLVDFHLFEMDETEARRLERKYSNDPRIKVYSTALFSTETELKYNVSEHRALNSLFEANRTLISGENYMVTEFSVFQQCNVRTRTIDSVFADQPVHFLKLDIEGAELEALKGSVNVLDRSVLGVRSEVLFAPVFEGAPLFGDLNQFMFHHGFELLNLDYTGAGNKAGRFTFPGRYGKLLSTDAVWAVTGERLFRRKGQELIDDVVRYALFLMCNGATDLAVETLLVARSDHDVRLSTVLDDPLVKELRRRILLLFKGLTSLPMFEEEVITECYRTLFDAEFPLMNRFYEAEF